MKFYHFILILLISSCSNKNKNYTAIDKIMIFTSDTTVFDDIGFGADDLMNIFFRDSSQFFRVPATNMNREMLDTILKNLNNIKGKRYAYKNEYLSELNFCKMWQIVFFNKNIRNCVICLNETKNLLSVNDTIFEIDKNILLHNTPLRYLSPAVIPEKSKIFTSRTIYINSN